jgi:hypothetical protein
VGGERQRQTLELPAAPGGVGALGALRRATHHQQVAVGERLAPLTRAARAGSQLAHELM